MTSDLAKNSQRATKTLYGEPSYMPGQYDNPLIPLEEQVPNTSFTSTDTAGTITGPYPRQRNWLIRDNLAGGNVVYALTNPEDMIGRDTVISIECTNGGTNTVSFVLPAGWFWEYTGAAYPLVRQTAITPQLGTTAALLRITWVQGRGIITAPTTGWTFA